VTVCHSIKRISIQCKSSIMFSQKSKPTR